MLIIAPPRDLQLGGEPGQPAGGGSLSKLVTVLAVGLATGAPTASGMSVGHGSKLAVVLPLAAVAGVGVGLLALTRFQVYVMLMLVLRASLDLAKLSGPAAGKREQYGRLARPRPGKHPGRAVPAGRGALAGRPAPPAGSPARVAAAPGAGGVRRGRRPEHPRLGPTAGQRARGVADPVGGGHVRRAGADDGGRDRHQAAAGGGLPVHRLPAGLHHLRLPDGEPAHRGQGQLPPGHRPLQPVQHLRSLPDAHGDLRVRALPAPLQAAQAADGCPAGRLRWLPAAHLHPHRDPGHGDRPDYRRSGAEQAAPARAGRGRHLRVAAGAAAVGPLHQCHRPVEYGQPAERQLPGMAAQLLDRGAAAGQRQPGLPASGST